MFRNTIFILFLLIITLNISCSHYNELQKSGRESGANEHSHNAGEDCMSCHHDSKSDASQRWWYVAGTAFTSTGNVASSAGEVQLWTGQRATGTLIHKLPIDRDGNFYTEKIINFKGGYFPVIISAGDTFAMTEMVNSDQFFRGCNNCHGHDGNGLNTPPITLN